MWPEVLPAFGIIVGCITVTGLALKYLDRYEHSGKVSLCSMCVVFNGVLYLERYCTFSPILQPGRYRVDEWDLRMMQRDKRITGSEDKQRV